MLGHAWPLKAIEATHAAPARCWPATAGRWGGKRAPAALERPRAGPVRRAEAVDRGCSVALARYIRAEAVDRGCSVALARYIRAEAVDRAWQAAPAARAGQPAAGPVAGWGERGGDIGAKGEPADASRPSQAYPVQRIRAYSRAGPMAGTVPPPQAAP